MLRDLIQIDKIPDAKEINVKFGVFIFPTLQAAHPSHPVQSNQ